MLTGEGKKKTISIKIHASVAKIYLHFKAEEKQKNRLPSKLMVTIIAKYKCPFKKYIMHHLC